MPAPWQDDGYADSLTFEFIETEEIFDKNHILLIIEDYRRHGFEIALDDYGTCYSGVARLADLRPDIIKLDRCLIQDCDKNRTRPAIVASMISVSSELGIKVVAEGIERRDEVESLRSGGVRFMQGFYFARPMPEGIADSNAIPWQHA